MVFLSLCFLTLFVIEFLHLLSQRYISLIYRQWRSTNRHFQTQSVILNTVFKSHESNSASYPECTYVTVIKPRSRTLLTCSVPITTESWHAHVLSHVGSWAPSQDGSLRFQHACCSEQGEHGGLFWLGPGDHAASHPSHSPGCKSETHLGLRGKNLKCESELC